jgi:phosphoserine phosphatase
LIKGKKAVMKKPKIAIIYDFDGTLSPSNMQESAFIPSIVKKNNREFWKEVNSYSKKHDADNITSYMKLMIDYSIKNNAPIDRDTFRSYGANIPFYKGVEEWFDLINCYSKQAEIQHFIISSGNKEVIEGTKIAKKFKAVFACEFIYENGKAVWPAAVVNYTTKMQYVFRINKNSYNNYDSKIVNKVIPKEKRDIPFTNMIFIGDGETDIPCMKLIKEEGGFSIGVYPAKDKKRKEVSEDLLKAKRVNYICCANYKAGSPLAKTVKLAIDKIIASEKLLKSL